MCKGFALLKMLTFTIIGKWITHVKATPITGVGITVNTDIVIFSLYRQIGNPEGQCVLCSEDMEMWERANIVDFQNFLFLRNISNLFQINCRWNEGFYTNFQLWWIRDQKDAFAEHHHFIITANVKDNLPFNATFLKLLQLIFCQKEIKLRISVKMYENLKADVNILSTAV